ncbi:hypothetical protein [Sulfurimonas sp.]|uniref:hypothetical protein n=1 Tax=Sulfurimonas sp. TaxID=2022749 RepID=UPI003568DCCD
MKIIIRADGSNYRGMGHISKQVTLYKELSSIGHELLFVTKHNVSTLSILDINNVNYISFEGDKYFNIYEIIGTFIPDLIILDILDTSMQYIDNLKQNNVKIITFDNTDESSFMCDMIFNVMYYHNNNLKEKYKNFTVLHEGYKYIIMNSKYSVFSKEIGSEVKNILLTQGGSDTSEKTPFLLSILLNLGCKYNIEVVIGPAFSNNNIYEIEKIASENTNININYKPSSLFELIKKSDLVVTAGGTTMWEIAALKIPMYVYVNEAFEDETATIIKELGFALYNGFNPSKNDIIENLKNIVTNFEIREELHNNMKKYNISSGVSRIVNLIDEGNKNV